MVNFGMANASLKWNNHITGILKQIEDQNEELEKRAEQENVEEAPEEEEDVN